MKRHLILYGFGIWAAGTVALRLARQHLLRPGGLVGILILFAISFPLMGLIVRRICSRFGLPREQWLEAGFLIALPTLLLDPFSSAFFPVVFPNMAPSVAGVFGGWMLWCCAGALVGASIAKPGKT